MIRIHPQGAILSTSADTGDSIASLSPHFETSVSPAHVIKIAQVVGARNWED